MFGRKEQPEELTQEQKDFKEELAKNRKRWIEHYKTSGSVSFRDQLAADIYSRLSYDEYDDPVDEAIMRANILVSELASRRAESELNTK